MKDFIQKLFFVRKASKNISFFAITAFFLLTICTSIKAQIIAFDTNGLAGNEVTINSTTTAANLNQSTLSRGAGINPNSLVNSFNSSGFDSTTLADAITANEYLQFTVSPQSGFQVSLSTLDANFRRSSSGPDTFQYQYSLDGFATSGINIGSPISFTNTTTNGVAQAQINLSTISALQNVASPTVITFRLYAYNTGGTGTTSGTFAIGRLTGNDLAVGGTVSVVTSQPDLTISQSAPASVTVGNSYNYTLTVNNTGGTNLTTVDVDFTIPSGVTYNAAVSNCTSTTLTSGVLQLRGCSVSANSSTIFTVNVTAPATTQTITSTGTNVIVDPNNTIAESNEANNTAATVTTNVTAGTTAAVVDVGGRVTNFKGRPIAGALVTLTDTSGKKLFAYTDSSGNYLFEAVEVGQVLVFEARAKKYSFTQPLQVVSLSEENVTVNFVGYEERRAF